MPLRWPSSRRIEFDENGERAAGAIAYFYEAGTTTPLTVFQDAGLATPHAHGLEADGIGRWPEVWVPFSATDYRERVVTATGSLLWDTDSITRTDPVEAAADTVDDTQLLQTGDFLFSPKSGTRSGFVRANGRTIGSATSGATERANADTEDLYLFFWNNFSDSILAVSGGRGASAAADWAANKPIAVFDLKGGTLFGLDDMGGTAASRFSTSTFATGNATTGGSVVGANSVALATGNLPPHLHPVSITSGTESQSHTHSGTTGTESQSHTHSGTTGSGSAHTHDVVGYPTATGGSNTGIIASAVASGSPVTVSGGNNVGSVQNESNHTHAFTSGNASQSHTHSITTGNTSQTHTHLVSGNTGNTGSGTAVDKVPRSVLGNWLIKL